ncbi:MAG: galactokinase [Opitutales bacterium]
MKDKVRKLYQTTFGEEPECIAFAPGRIEFIGNHTDYNGGLVLGAAVAEGIMVAAGKRRDGRFHLTSELHDFVETSIDALKPGADAQAWANYPLGVAAVMQEQGMPVESGFNWAATSSLPAGAGLSSSAALELATAYALAELIGFKADAATFARIGRRAENEFVKMPCGILDQGVSAFGRAGHLVKIDCATEAFSIVPMPEGVRFWVFDSNKKHSLVDSQYGDRHRECSEAFERLKSQHPGIASLSSLDENQLRASAATLPETLFKRALHIVTENARVREVEQAFASGNREAAGRALNASHESSRVNFENSTEELDFLVAEVCKRPDVCGARLTGGGFGGSVLAMTNPAFSDSDAAEVARAYRERFGIEPNVLPTRAGDGARVLYS